MVRGLFSLPAEIRLEIYDMCLGGWRPNDGEDFPALASVCHQLREETIPLIIREAPRFQCTFDFLSWASRGSPYHLNLIKVFQCDWIVSAELQRLGGEFDTPQCTDPDTIPISFGQALRAMPNIIDFRLEFYEFPDTLEDLVAFHPGPQERLLARVSATNPNIEHLVLDDHLIYLDCLRGFQNLTSLTSSGYSLSTPEDTLRILTSLPRLNSISIRCHASWPGCISLLKQQVSITPAVLRALKPLKSFRLRSSVPCKINNVIVSNESDFVTEEMFEALSVHQESLKDLNLVIGRTNSLKQVERIVTGSDIRELFLACCPVNQQDIPTIPTLDVLVPSMRKSLVLLGSPSDDGRTAFTVWQLGYQTDEDVEAKMVQELERYVIAI